MESVKMEQTKSAKKVERIILDSESVEKIKTWVNQIGKELGDTVDVTQKFLVNFIIQTHQLELNGDEIQQIKAQTFDLIKALKKATDEAIKAKQAGNEMQLTEIINLIQTPSVKADLQLKRSYKKRTKSQDSKSNVSQEFASNTQNMEGL
jgi:hypothetical protein